MRGATSDARISSVAWRAPQQLEYPDWALEGKRIGVMARGSPWWIGDWLCYGAARWGEMYVAAARITGYDPKSLRNMRYVASRFEVSLRRDDLTWSHHSLLASFDADGQRHWLDRASEERMSVEDLRVELRAIRRVASTPPADQSRLERHDKIVILCPNCGDPVPVPVIAAG
jgi:hypothetical protein